MEQKYYQGNLKKKLIQVKAIKSDNYQTLLHFLMSPLQISAMLNVLIFTAWRITQYVRLKKINLGCQLFFGDWSF